jgi:hypothetical protein
VFDLHIFLITPQTRGENVKDILILKMIGTTGAS